VELYLFTDLTLQSLSSLGCFGSTPEPEIYRIYLLRPEEPLSKSSVFSIIDRKGLNILGYLLDATSLIKLAHRIG
jgi:hypothetical protein